MLQVDRGYLMAADVGGRRHVKALKVVGFTNTLLNTVATEVCPEWSEWVQSAVQMEAAKLAGGTVTRRPVRSATRIPPVLVGPADGRGGVHRRRGRAAGSAP